MLILILFAFLAGVITILSPCILPVLPIVLSSSLTGGKSRPLGVVFGFVLSFTFFTLALTAIVKSTGLAPDLLRNIAVVVILFFGISMLLPQTQVLMERLFGFLSRFTPQSSPDEESGFWGGLVVGLSLGLIWTPCAGPILASVITLAATSSVTLQAVLITLAYSLGTAIPMFFIIIGGRKLLDKVPFLVRNSAKIQKFFGLIIILVAGAIFFDYHLKFQAYILDKIPAYSETITKIEELDIVNQKLKELNMNDHEANITEQCSEGLGMAPGFEKMSGEWLGSPALKMSELRGKVVLVDFWTYTCINCIRTLPYLTAWHDKYSDDGLVIVGVHTPEFEFEKVKKNVERAMFNFDIKYPVVQDNDYGIWQDYNNRFWPAKYFIDKNGCIRDQHFGEGAYEDSEKMIQELLAETGADVETDVLDLEEYKGEARTAETYLGYQRMEHFASPEDVKPGVPSFYSLPDKLDEHFFAFYGDWIIEKEHSLAFEGDSLVFNFTAREVFLVMRGKGRVRVLIDGEELNPSWAGEDVDENGIVTVDADRLYKLIKLPVSTNHNMTLNFLDDDMEVFAFTFG